MVSFRIMNYQKEFNLARRKLEESGHCQVVVCDAVPAATGEIRYFSIEVGGCLWVDIKSDDSKWFRSHRIKLRSQLRSRNAEKNVIFIQRELPALDKLLILFHEMSHLRCHLLGCQCQIGAYLDDESFLAEKHADRGMLKWALMVGNRELVQRALDLSIGADVNG